MRFSLSAMVSSRSLRVMYDHEDGVAGARGALDDVEGVCGSRRRCVGRLGRAGAALGADGRRARREPTETPSTRSSEKDAESRTVVGRQRRDADLAHDF